MALRSLTCLAVLVMVLSLAWPNSSPAQERSTGSDLETQPKKSFQKDVLPFVAKNCVRCHGLAKAEADLSLERFKDDLSMQKNRKVWDNVVHMLSTHEMPPAGESQPRAEDVQRTIEAINSILSDLDCGKPGSMIRAGRVTIRRLNKTEYNNTIRDLVGIHFQPAADFPADDVGYGFDNIGDVLNFSPLLAEKYLIAAESIVEEAIKIVDPPSKTKSPVGQLRPEFAIGKVEQSGFIALEEGDYTIQAKVYAEQAGDEVARAKIRVSSPSPDNETHFESAEFDIPSRSKDRPTTIEMSVRVKKGSYRVGVLFLNPGDSVPSDLESSQAEKVASLIKTRDEKDALANTRFNSNLPLNAQISREARQAARQESEEAINSLKSLGVVTRKLFVRSIDTEGPGNPPKPALPETHMRLMAHADGLDDRQAAREIITRFASRAFRRPVRQAEVDECLALFDTAAKYNRRFEPCVRAALLRVLVSPHFLFRIENDPPDVQPGTSYHVSEYELASRLSYFLWNSMPDDKLLALAANGKLRSEIDAQVGRMIKDPKSSSMIEDFAVQWLALRKLDLSSPDPTLFPNFTQELRESMIRESVLFFGEMVRENRSILDLLDADFTWVNESLAKLYGIPDVKGSAFVRVGSPAHRGGILTQASILTLTSNATRTSPVKRGKFVLEQILNTPPPPPPPEVPELDEARVLSGNLRQVMEQHRSDKKCASCHAKMDPIGFAFENFDAIGAWRTKDGQNDVDASGVLPGGQAFTGPNELKQIMRADKDLFVRCIVEKMLTYATGRGMEYYDQCVVDGIVKSLHSNDFKFSRLITEIVHSQPFQMRTAPPASGESQ
ncbi:MAG: DUF1592 domain-containing protein [Pirellula sp.]